MTLPSIASAPPTRAELEAQLDAAIARHEEAQAAEQKAVEAFDAAGDDLTAKALQKARAAVALAGEHVGRAERLLCASHDAAAERTREEIAERMRELEAGLTNASLTERRRAALNAEAGALIAASEAFAQRYDVERSIAADRNALNGCRIALGHPAITSSINERLKPSPVFVAQALLTAFHALPASDVRREYLYALAQTFGGAR